MGAAKKIDTTNTNPEYWDGVLADKGLAMKVGLPPRKMFKGKKARKTFGAGTSIELGRVAEDNYSKKLGRVTPSGSGPE